MNPSLVLRQRSIQKEAKDDKLLLIIHVNYKEGNQGLRVKNHHPHQDQGHFQAVIRQNYGRIERIDFTRAGSDTPGP
jgi:hypothetical protein